MSRASPAARIRGARPAATSHAGSAALRSLVPRHASRFTRTRRRHGVAPDYSGPTHRFGAFGTDEVRRNSMDRQVEYGSSTRSVVRCGARLPSPAAYARVSLIANASTSRRTAHWPARGRASESTGTGRQHARERHERWRSPKHRAASARTREAGTKSRSRRARQSALLLGWPVILRSARRFRQGEACARPE